MYKRFIDNLEKGVVNEDYVSTRLWVQVGAFDRPFLQFHKRGYLTPHLPETFCSLSTCVPGHRRLFVNVDGDYFPCERVPDSDEMKIGSIREGVDVCKVYQMLEEWVNVTRDQCRSCWCLPTCTVGCFASIHEGGILTMDAKLEACEKHRRNAHRTIVDYCSVLEKNPNAFDYAAGVTFM